MKILDFFRMAKMSRILAIAASAAMVLLFTVTAHATPASAQSIIYFDSQNNLIGQQIIDCHGWQAHSGNINQSNPYKIEEIWYCGTALDVQCTSGSGGGAPSCVVLGNPGPSYEATYFLSATGATYANYCSAGPGDGFNDHPTCGQLMPLGILIPFTQGWN